MTLLCFCSLNFMFDHNVTLSLNSLITYIQSFSYTLLQIASKYYKMSNN